MEKRYIVNDPWELDFPENEYRSRADRAQQLMKELDISALFLSHKDNLLYFTGFRTWLGNSQHRPFAAVIPAQGDPILILPSGQYGNVRLKSWIKEVWLWEATDDYTAIYADALNEMNAADKNIGIEMGNDMWLGMPIREWSRLQSLLPKAQFVSSTDLIWEIRSVKSLLEIDLLTKAAYITDQSVKAAWDNLKPGMSEKQLASIIGASMMAEGADNPGFLIVQSGSVRTKTGVYSAGDKYATSREMQKGEIVLLDIGCSYNGYSSDMIRCAHLGNPSPSILRAYELGVAINRACLSKMKAGVSIHEVEEARNNFYIEHNVPVITSGGVGHSIGLAFHELPRIGFGGSGILKAGMVVTCEPGLIYENQYCCIEDMVVITESGYEYCTNAPRDLFF